MTIAGSEVQLVSRCASVEEFLAAFRTYVHRDHVFVPTTDPISAGRKGRIAITLADGTPVLSGVAEILSSSAVPQGPYQKPGIRLRFVALDDAARQVIERFERSRAEPATADDESRGVGSGARHDILITRAGDGGDPTEPAMCAVVEAAAPTRELATSRPRVDLTPPPVARPPSGPIPRPAPSALPVAPNVPGKSFKIPSIPSVPPRAGHGSTPPAGTVTAPAAPVQRMDTPPAGTIRMSALPPRAPAVPAAPVAEHTGPVSGEMTVPTASVFPEPSLPWKAPPPAVAPPASPGGKARNRAVLAQSVKGRPAEVEAVLAAAEPITEETPPVHVDPAPPPPPPTPAAGRTYARTLLGLPVIAIVPERATQSGVHPMPTPTPTLDSDAGWTAPEDGTRDESTERAETPQQLELGAIPGGDDDDDDDRRDDGPAAAAPAPIALIPSEAATVPIATAPAHHHTAAPPWPPQPVVAPPVLPAFAQLPPPVAPPQQYPVTERMDPHIQALANPATAAGPWAPPPPVAAVPVAIARHAEPTEVVRPFVDRDPGDDTDVIALRRRQRRPLIIAAVAIVLVTLGVIVVVASRGGDGKTAGTGTGARTGTGTATNAAVTPPAVDAAVAAAAAIGVDAAVKAVAPPADAAGPGPGSDPEAPETDVPDEPDQPDQPEPEPPPVATKVPPPPAGKCAVAFSSTPQGAEVTVAGKKRGATPVTVHLPCGKASASFARQRYEPASKGFVARAGTTTKVSARLERPSFSIKVTSTPSGATVSVRGKSGKTPFTAKVPGYQAVSIKVSKAGYQTRSTKVTPKKNGTSVNVALKRGN